MFDFAIEIPVTEDDLFDDINPRPSPSSLISEYLTFRCYLFTSDDVNPLSEWSAGSTILGAWDRHQADESGYLQAGESFDELGDVVGTPTHPIQSNFNQYVMPLGNLDGRATGITDCLKWQGAPSGKYQDGDYRYPVGDTPFVLKITRVEHVAPDPFPGWGWTVEMLSDSPERDITARAVGIYSDPECTAYLYTTGAFIQDGSHDNNYYTECPVGQRQPTDAQVNFALLLGAAQEGFFNLPEGGGEVTSLFWSHDQT